MRELRQLSEDDGGSDKKQKIRRTKECLISIGIAIEDVDGSAEDGWKYVAAKCRTALSGSQLANVYRKLTKQADRE